MRVQLIAHRGAHQRAPENSLASMAAALSHGADGIEVDVHCTKDGMVVVHHDGWLPDESAPNGQRRIDSLLFAEISEFSLADGTCIPTLDEVLSVVSGKAHLYVELKAAGIEERVLRSISPSHGSVSIHGFDHRAIKKCGQIDDRVRRGILLEARLIDTAAAMAAAGATDVWQHHERIDADLVDEIRAAGGRLIAWTVNEPDAAVALAAAGVDAVCTDAITPIREALARA